MKLAKLSVENYKSYLEKQEIFVEHGFNIFLGGNNAGKTTMLEPLDMDSTSDIPHRSIKNLHQYGNQPSGRSTLSFHLETDIFEIRNPQTKVATLLIGDDWRDNFPNSGNPIDLAISKLAIDPKVELVYEFGAYRQALTVNSVLGSGVTSSSTGSCLILTVEAPDNRNVIYRELQNHAGNFVGDTNPMLSRLTSAFYRFSAHRRPAGQCGETSHPVVLLPDASNLAYCLNVLQSGDAFGHGTLCKWINRIFPSIQWVQASPRPGNVFEIECLPLAPSERRYDLAVPLDKMGSGIGNVIAMLYVVLTARFPRVIAIDEPNSFLHPKALRELLQIFSVEGKEHQYLLTAHSADVLTAVPPSLVTMFNVVEGATVTTQVKGDELASIREGLSDLGIRMTDLHGRDRVLWVEGQTEELVIPRLLQKFCPEIAPGTAVLRVEHTGTFEKRGVDPKEVAAVYSRLTSSAGLVPPMVAILLDRETRNSSECARLTESSVGVLRFLPERMLENYVLDSDAIAHVLLGHGEAVNSSDLIAELHKKRSNFTASSIDGARVLKEIFDAFTECRTEFKKTRDVPAMIDWLLANRPAVLENLGDFLRDLFGLPPLKTENEK